MLYSDEERAIMARAIQPNMRFGNVLVEPFEAIVREHRLRLEPGMRILDIGPGQCDFLDVAKARGTQTTGIDFDPAICELGRLRGHRMECVNLQATWPPDLGRFDGIFCRGSLNPHWFANQPQRLSNLLERMSESLEPGGWLWIAPWSQPVAAGDRKAIDAIDQVVATWLASRKLYRWSPLPAQCDAYGIAYTIPRVDIWSDRPAPYAATVPRDGASSSTGPAATLVDYAAALQLLNARGDVEYLTYRDLAWEDDNDYAASFPQEWKRWNQRVKGDASMKRKVHLLIQHDTDSGPAETIRMAQLEAAYGARSSIMTFARLPVRMGEPETKPYGIDWEQLRDLQSRGFEIGYHCNAFHLTAFQPSGLAEAFEADVAALRAQGLTIDFFTVHGGRASPAGEINSSFDYPALTGTRLRWVNTRYSPRFEAYYSDGGTGNGVSGQARQDCIAHFIAQMRPGRRYRLLVHSQYFSMAGIDDAVCMLPPWPTPSAQPAPSVQTSPTMIPRLMPRSTPAPMLALPEPSSDSVWNSTKRMGKSLVRSLIGQTRLYRRLHELRRMPQRMAGLQAQVSRQAIELEQLRMKNEILRSKNEVLREKVADLYERSTEYARRLSERNRDHGIHREQPPSREPVDAD